MLLYFRVKNYMSFKGNAILDMRATSYIQHKKHIINVDEKTDLLKTVAIYGSNASGKSNLVSAMYSFKMYILSIFLTNNSDESNEKKPIKIEPFLLNNTNDSTEFEIVFTIYGKQIQYGFEMDIDQKIISEWYYIDDKMVFEINENNLAFGSDYKKILQKYNKVPMGKSYLPVLDYFLEGENKEQIIDGFIEFFKMKFRIFSEIFFESAIKNIAGIVSIRKELIQDEDFRNAVSEALRGIDTGIQRLSVQEEEIYSDDNKTTKKITIKTIHNIYDNDNNIIGEKKFDLHQESSGTLRFLAYIQNVILMIENGGVFIADEITSRLHPLLSKLIVDLFQSEKNSKAQLIFTTHDISLLNKDQFRRDEVYFIDKNEYGASKIYALSDLKVREDSSFNKDYLQGKYGAIPIFDTNELWGVE